MVIGKNCKQQFPLLVFQHNWILLVTFWFRPLSGGYDQFFSHPTRYRSKDIMMEIMLTTCYNVAIFI